MKAIEIKRIKIIINPEEINIYLENPKKYSPLDIYKIKLDKIYEFYIENEKEIFNDKILNDKILEEKLLKSKWFPIYNMEDNIDMVLFTKIDNKNIYIFIYMEDIYNSFDELIKTCFVNLSLN